jgi:hypothetical protein
MEVSQDRETDPGDRERVRRTKGQFRWGDADRAHHPCTKWLAAIDLGRCGRCSSVLVGRLPRQLYAVCAAAPAVARESTGSLGTRGRRDGTLASASTSATTGPQVTRGLAGVRTQPGRGRRRPGRRCAVPVMWCGPVSALPGRQRLTLDQRSLDRQLRESRPRATHTRGQAVRSWHVDPDRPGARSYAAVVRGHGSQDVASSVTRSASARTFERPCPRWPGHSPLAEAAG